MDQHLKIVGWLHAALGALGVLTAVVVATILTGVGAASGEAGAFAALSGIGGALAIFVSVLSLPAIIGGWGILTYKPWSRVLVLVLSFLNILNFPFGTAVGAYSIWVLLNDESRRLLDAGGPQNLRYVPPGA